jgi:hypothetical protein
MHDRLPLIAVLCFALCFAARGDDSRQPSTDQPVFAESGGVEIVSINVVRKQIADRTNAGELSNMAIDLWLAQPADEKKSHRIYAVKMLKLDPIEDDTGKELSPPARRDAMAFLKDELKTSRDKTRRGKWGPIVSVPLDVPAKGAMRIKSLKGTAVVSISERLKFDDLSQVKGKRLEHEKLTDLPVQPSIKVEGGQTTVTLRVPVEHSRIEAWGVGKKDRLLRPTFESSSEVEGGAALIKTYQGDLTQSTFLGIVLADPSKTKSYDFEFKNVELP